MKILYTVYIVSVVINLIFFVYDMKYLIKSCHYKYKNIAVPMACVIYSFMPVVNAISVFSLLISLYLYNKLPSDMIKWK